MTRINENGPRFGAKAFWSVVVVYQDGAARERAVDFCDQLVARFWSRFAFDVSWWSFDQLEELIAAGEAKQKATGAELIVFSSTLEGEPPLHVKAWLEGTLGQRKEREGVLVGIMDAPPVPPVAEAPKHRYLRTAAHQAAMDYLTQLPPDLARTMPDSLDSYTSRADHVTSLLDNILHQQPSLPTPLP
jgi:hypothetical protein